MSDERKANEDAVKAYTVIATNIKTGIQRVMETGLTEKNAEAFIKFAVMRRGVDEEFYSMQQEIAG